MTYERVVGGRFVSRPNRFVALVEIDGEVQTVHVKNTGRCRELLLPGVQVLLAESNNLARKTKYDLVAVYKERAGKNPLLINMDSQAPNAVAVEWLHKCGLFSEDAILRREVRYGTSRFDCYIEDGLRCAFVEVKGVTLEQDGIAAFPDAPTERGIKHLRELAFCVEQGYEAYLLFIVQMKEIHTVRPNDVTHPAFGKALREAVRAGVKVLAVDCVVTENGLYADKPIAVVL